MKYLSHQLKGNQGKHSFLIKLGAAALITLPSCIGGDSKESENGEIQNPNIIFIFSDDLSYRDLSSYEQEKFSTPNLDSLAMNGMRFTQAYCGSPECAPTRASLMTGMHMGHCRIRANKSVRGQDHLEKEDVTVAEVLKKAGYTTGFVGKWGIGLPGTEGVPNKQGFDHSYGYYDQSRAHGYFPNYLMKDGKTVPIPENYGFNMERVYEYNQRPIRELNGVRNVYNQNGHLIPDGVSDPSKAKYSENLFQSDALAFIKENKNKPFFLYYATQIPHGPTIIPDLGKYKNKPWSLKHKEWAAMIRKMDHGVGRMVDLLKDLNIFDNTIIFFAGDNGYSMYGYFGRPDWEDDPLFENKGPWPKGKFTSTHEGGVRVPFFAYWKGKIEPGKTDHICALYDFMATAADLGGVSVPETDGISLVPTILGKPENQKKHKYLYWENGSKSQKAQSVRMNQWWAYRSDPSKPIHLYDISKDISCENNVAKENPDIITKVEQIFREAHVDSKWYVNPGESRARIETKKEKAQERGQMQNSVGPNTTKKHPMKEKQP